MVKKITPIIFFIAAIVVLAQIALPNFSGAKNATSTVQVTICGNGIIEGGEFCDDGENNRTYVYGIDPRYCYVDCLFWAPACGDSLIQAGFGEICDNNSQSCLIGDYNGARWCNSATCAAWLDCVATEFCGDSVKNGPEICDGDSIGCIENGYNGARACAVDCLGYGDCVVSENCGDNIINGDEICDGNSQNCVVNGYDGDQYCNETCSGWQACATAEYCGDGIKNGNEQCDGNAGCSASCQLTGGGGGGGSYGATKVILNGRAYPSSTVTVLKDGQIATAVKADANANFRVEITDITAGVWTFGLWSEDKNGNRSITFSFTANVNANMTTTINGIFLPPTIQLDKTNVKKGEPLGILGQTAPKSEIQITINSGEPIVIEKIKPDAQGAWFHVFDTSPLEYGSHTTRAKATANDGAASGYSNMVSFSVGSTSFYCSKNPDLNNDKRVNLVDFSILLYNWGTPKNKVADINCDGKTNLTDFSIMMYYWTG